MASKLCPFCMQMAEGEVCSHCGKNVQYDGQPMHLPAGCVLNGTHPYVLGAALGQGGFGITYIALDMVTGVRVAIKEYYPTYCAARINNSTVTAYPNQEEVYLKGMRSFLEEARTLKSLSDLKSIVNVLDFFEANNTAYLVMEFLEGSSLKDYAMKNGVFSAQKFLEQICPLMEDLERMHQRGVIHRDIAPDNIILQPDGQMKLIDFGAARSYVGDKSMAMVVKKGFAPVEQYLSKGTTASTDVYALAATIYYCITGTVPMEAPERQYENVPLPSLTSFGADVTPGQEKAIAKALEIQQKERTQSMQAFLDDLNRERPAPKPEPEKAAPEKPAKKETAPEKNRKSAEKSDAKSVQKSKDHQEKQKPAPKPSKKTSDKTAQGRKKTAGAIAAAVLVILAVFGFFLVNRNPGDAPQKLEAGMETAAGPAWKENVLMADETWDEDYNKLWEGKFYIDVAEQIQYFSARSVFNTNIPRNKIKNVFFLDSVSSAPKKVYDVSAYQNGTVLAWTEDNEKGGYNLYIAGEGGVNGVNACHLLFAYYTELEVVHFNNSFFTDDAENMSSMFQNCYKLTSLDLSSFDTSNVTNMAAMFTQCKNLTSLDLDVFDTSNVTDMSNMFNSCNLTSLDLRSFDTSNVANMSAMFSHCRNLTSLNLSSFDTSNVTDMSQMFNCCSLTSLDLSSFDTFNATDMRGMFQECWTLTALDLNGFDTSNVTDMSSMFSGLKKITYLDLSSWNTSHVTDMSGMFDLCENLTSLDLSSWNTSHVTDMSWMFSGCKNLTSLDLSSWNTSHVTNMSWMFSGCKNLTSLDLSSWNTSHVTDMSWMFNGCEKLKTPDFSSFDTSEVMSYWRFMDAGKKIDGLPWEEWFQKSKTPKAPAAEKPASGEMGWKNNVLIADASWDVDQAKFWREKGTASREEQAEFFSARPAFNTDIPRNKIKNIFFLDSLATAPEKVYDVSAYQNGTVLAWTEENGEDTLDLYIAGEGGVNGKKACYAMFDFYTNLESVHFDGNFFTDDAKSMYHMFANCGNLKSLDLSSFDKSNVADLSYMFYFCENLTSLDLSNFDTSNVTNMTAMFYPCKNLTSLDLSSFDTSNVTDMRSIFNGCQNLTSLDLSSFDTSNVTNMSMMFSGCENLTSLDLSSWNTSHVTDMSWMFNGCEKLKAPDLSSFDTSEVISYSNFMNAGKKVDGLPWEEWFQKSKTPKAPAAEKPVSGEMGWEKNVLMADETLDEDIARFRKEKPGAYESEMYDFYGQRPAFNTDIPRGKVSSVTFLDSLATAPETVYDVSANQDGSVLAWAVKNNNGNFDLHIAGEGGVNGVEACRALFYGYRELKTVNFNNSFFTDTTQNMSNMFTYCKKLKTVDMSSLNTAGVTDMSGMFSNCEALSSLDLSTFDTSNVRNMSFMFAYSPKLKTLDISSFDTSNITDMSYMFARMTSMVSFDLSHFDTSNVTNMHGMFYGCSNDKFKSLDVSSFDTSNVTDMGYMFADCPFITALDLRNFDTSKVINMSSMFYYCRRLTSLDLSSFDTSNVTNMHAMFDTCSLLPALEISHFNTKRVTDMGYMFNKCGYLRTVDVTQFEVPLLRVTTDMFNGCDKLPVEYKQIGGKYIWYW